MLIVAVLVIAFYMWDFGRLCHTTLANGVPTRVPLSAARTEIILLPADGWVSGISNLASHPLAPTRYAFASPWLGDDLIHETLLQPGEAIWVPPGWWAANPP